MRTAKILVAASLAAALAACGSGNRSVYSVNQPVVERSQFALDVNVMPGSGLTDSEAARLNGWFDAINVGYGDKIAIDYGSNYANTAAEGAVERLAARRGLQLSGVAPITGQPLAPGTVRVVVSRTTASVPGCPDWSYKSEANHQSSTSSNYGCAVNSNYAAMIADPEDLVRGSDSGTSNIQQGVRAINAYNNREAAAGETTESGLGGGGDGGQ